MATVVVISPRDEHAPVVQHARRVQQPRLRHAPRGRPRVRGRVVQLRARENVVATVVVVSPRDEHPSVVQHARRVTIPFLRHAPSRRPGARGWIVQLRAREIARATSPRDEHTPVVQHARRVPRPHLGHVARGGPGARGGVVQFRARQRA